MKRDKHYWHGVLAALFIIIPVLLWIVICMYQRDDFTNFKMWGLFIITGLSFITGYKIAKTIKSKR